MLRLLLDLSEADRQLRVLNTVNKLLERLGRKVTDCMEFLNQINPDLAPSKPTMVCLFLLSLQGAFALGPFTSILPTLWQRSASMGLLQVAVVDTLTTLMEVPPYETAVFLSLMVPCFIGVSVKL